MTKSNFEGLQHGWRRVQLGDVVDNVNDFYDRSCRGAVRYVAGEHLDEGDLRVLRYGMTTDDLVPPTFKRLFKAGDVLFHSRNIKKLARPDFNGLTGEKLFVLRTKNQEQLAQALLPFLLQSERFANYVQERWAGSTNKFLNKTPLMAYEFALPPPQEQVRLTRLFEAWREAVDAAGQAIADARRMRRAAFSQFFEFGTRGEERTATPIGDLPKSWQVAPLGQRYEVQLGKMMSETARSALGKIPFLRNANVQWNRLDLDDVAQMAFSPREREKFSLRYGDILACEGRHVGKAAMWREEIPGACYQKALHRLRRLSDVDEPRYLLHCLQHYSWTGRFIAVTGETTIPHLPAERFRAMLFPFPTLGEQIEIAEAIKSIDDAVANLEGRQRLATATLSAAIGECLGRVDV